MLDKRKILAYAFIVKQITSDLLKNKGVLPKFLAAAEIIPIDRADNAALG